MLQHFDILQNYQIVDVREPNELAIASIKGTVERKTVITMNLHVFRDAERTLSHDVRITFQNLMVT